MSAYEKMRGEIRAGVHPLIIMIRYDMTSHDVLTEVCFLAGVTPPWPDDAKYRDWRYWLPRLASVSLM